jgi:hypothetical protein
VTVTVDHVEQVWDNEGELIYDTLMHDTLLPRAAFDDAPIVRVEDFEGWWEKQEPVLRDQLTSLLADPGPAHLQEDVKSGLVVMLPIARRLIADPDFDVVEEALPQFKEAALMNIQTYQEASDVS